MEVTILPKKEGGKCRVHHGIRFSRQVCMCVITSAAASVADVNFPYFLFPISDHAYFLYMRQYTIPGGGGGGGEASCVVAASGYYYERGGGG